MILVPDIGFDWTVWKTFMERNGDRYSMWAITIPGMDKTEAPQLLPGEDWEAMRLTINTVSAIAQFIEENKIDRPVIVGHGYGGHMAMRLALDHPDLTRGIVSINGLPVQMLADPNQEDSLAERRLILRESLAPKMKMLTDQEWHDRHYATGFSLVTDGHRANELAAMLASQDRGVYSFFLFETILSDIRPRLQELRVPMLCIAPITPEPPPPPQIVHLTWQKALGAPPGAWLVYYPNCRHFVMDDNPQQLDVDISLFVAGKDVPGGQKSPTPIGAGRIDP
ncbi:MAG: alpha/beta hydrolase [Phycisphaerae bacterium]|nr:alpha/beta hydrolase [Phycisphaerae bacterium]